MVNDRNALALLSVGAVLAVVAGCQQSEDVASYTVHKPPPFVRRAAENPHAPQQALPPQGEPTDRMLGAIIPLAEEGWFFKLSGPKADVGRVADTYLEFLRSVRIVDGQPHWVVPTDWQQRPGSAMRYATLIVPSSGKPLELTVTKLPRSGDETAYILANVNRWRGQLSLPPASAEQVAEDSTEIKLEGATATLVDLVGHAAPTGMGRGPFMSGGRDGN
jgi:hypothetical protein